MQTRRAAINAVERAIDVDFCAALAEPARLEIIRVLMRLGTADVGSIAEQLSQDRSVVSRHLKHLLGVGMVSMSKVGRSRIYALDGLAILRRLELMTETLRKAITVCCPS